MNRVLCLLVFLCTGVVKTDAKGSSAVVETNTPSISVATVALVGTAKRDDNVVLACTHNVDNVNTMFWERNGRMIALTIKGARGVNISTSKYIGKNVSKSEYTLTIANFKESDGGQYRCGLESNGDTISTELTLTADPVPVDLLPHNDILLACEERANTGYVSWFKNDFLLFFNGTPFGNYSRGRMKFDLSYNILIENVSVEETGRYICRKDGIKISSFQLTVIDSTIPITVRPALSGTLGYAVGIGLGVVILFLILAIIMIQKLMTPSLKLFRKQMDSQIKTSDVCRILHNSQT